MRKVEVPLVRRHVGTFRLIAEITQIALVDDVQVRLLGDTVQLAILGGINGIEQDGKRLTQRETAPTAVTDVINALQLPKERGLVVEVIGTPGHRMPSGRLETAFAAGAGRTIAHDRGPSSDLRYRRV